MSVILTCLGPEVIWAQGYGMFPTPTSIPRTRTNPYGTNSQSNRPAQTPFQGSATIESVGPRGLVVIDGNGNSWTVQPEKNCKIELNGSADADFLKSPAASGQLVHFTAAIDRKSSKAISPINELEIVSPQAVITAEKGGGIGSGLGSATAAGKKGGTSAEPISVFGHLKEFKNNQITVESTVGMVTADLAANPTIKIALNDFHLAQSGDKVDVRGYYTKPGETFAQEMRITLATTLGGELSKKRGAKSTAAK
ncbi:MAG TPA: hypothetical protein VGI75_02150 [Pirellulales bacterium]